jgi:hypothetical protein
MRKLFLYIILFFPISSFALGPASVYFGISPSILALSGAKFFPEKQNTSLTNKKIAGFLGFRFTSMRCEGVIAYAPEVEVLLEDDSIIKSKCLDYSVVGFYDFSFLPTIYPYLGIKAGYLSSKDLGEGVYAGGISGFDLRLLDFLAIGINYELDYMPFMKEKNDASKKMKATNPIFHNIGLVLKFGF